MTESEKKIEAFVRAIRYEKNENACSLIGSERISGGLGMDMLVAALINQQRMINDLMEQHP